MKIIINHTQMEKVLKTIRQQLESDVSSFSFLWDLVPVEVKEAWEHEKKEKQKEKERKEEEATAERNRIAEHWATLHPLNQEWGIPPPPAVVSVAKDVSKYDPIDAWVNQYHPYLYERDGFLFRKMTQVREDYVYERSYKDLTFPSEHGHEIGLYTPRGEERAEKQSGERSEGEKERETERETEQSEGPRLSPSPSERGSGGEAKEETESAFVKTTADEKRERCIPMQSGEENRRGVLIYAQDGAPTAGEKRKEEIYILMKSGETERERVEEPPPPRKIIKVSDFDFKESERKIQKIAKAMETWMGPGPIDKANWETANAVIEQLKRKNEAYVDYLRSRELEKG